MSGARCPGPPPSTHGAGEETFINRGITTCFLTREGVEGGHCYLSETLALRYVGLRRAVTRIYGDCRNFD